MQKPISKNKRGKEPRRGGKKKGDEDEQGDEELKELRENQIKEGQAEADTGAEAGAEGNQGNEEAAAAPAQDTQQQNTAAVETKNDEDDLEL